MIATAAEYNNYRKDYDPGTVVIIKDMAKAVVVHYVILQSRFELYARYYNMTLLENVLFFIKIKYCISILHNQTSFEILAILGDKASHSGGFALGKKSSDLIYRNITTADVDAHAESPIVP